MFKIISGGYNSRHRQPFLLSRPKGNSFYVLLLIKSSAHLTISGNLYHVCPGTAVFLSPHTSYRYGSEDGDFQNDWIHFTCSDNDLRPEDMKCADRPVILKNPALVSAYFQQLNWEFHYAHISHREENTGMLVRLLLSNVVQSLLYADTGKPYSPYESGLQNLRLSMQSQPYHPYCPETLAEDFNISPSHFRFLYKELFHVSFQADLIRMRLEYAQDLILNTNLKMEQIALMSGYTNEVHFYRQFRKKTGMTPKEYQQSLLL